jgi:hypothetical protein
MLRPLLIIGVGGAGGKTIRAMKQELEHKLASAGHEGGLPSAWQFLQIDTTRDGHDFPAPMLSAEEFYSVVPYGQDLEGILQTITSKGDISDQQKMLSGWGIPDSAIKINSSPPQARAIGRQVGAADSVGTLKAIQTSIAKMDDPMAFAELVNLAKALNLDSPMKDPQAIIVASLAGRTGSGMFIDVAELLKRSTNASWTKSSISFLYTAEVFTSLSGGARDTAKNSLGAFNEISAGKLVGLSERSELLYQNLGLPPVAQGYSSGFGSRTNILIGTRNKTGVDISIGADGGGINEVFLTIGEALAGVLTDDVTSEWLFQQAFTHVLQAKSAVDVSGLAPYPPENPTFAAAGIGFGRLSLGADRVVDYVADALTKLQVEKLLWPDLNLDLLKDGITSQALIQEKANQIWPNFLIDSKLDEKGSQDQIINALLPEGWENQVRTFAKVVAHTSVGGEPMPLSNYAKNVFSKWDTESEKFLKSMQDAIHASAKAWVPSIQEHLKDHVASQLANSGYSVVLNLMDRLKNELADHSLAELLRESKEKADAGFKPDQGQFLNFVQDSALGLIDVGTRNYAFIEKIEKALAKLTSYQVNSHVNAIAASLIQDIIENFIEPVIKSLGNARADLDIQIRASQLADGQKNSFADFPKWGSGVINTRYKPRTIERILIDIAEYESTYEIYAQRDSGGNPPFHSSVTQALLGKKMNQKDGDPNKQTLIDASMPWTTNVREAQDGSGTAVSKVSWNFRTSLPELAGRNRKWLRHRDSSFGRFTTMPIREFLEAEGLDKKIKDQRENRFLSEFQAMLGTSQPLVLLNHNAMRYVISVSSGDRADGILFRSSKLPFDMNSSVGKACTVILQQSGEFVQAPGFDQKWFDAGSNDTTLFATSFTLASLPLWAYSSITKPILNEVAQSKNHSQTWDQFWDGRRSRPLVEAIPFETEMRRSIITGWFIATFFGMRKIEDVPAGRTAKIWNPTLKIPGWSTFPSPLLPTHPEDARRGVWMLPSILTSAGIALCEFGETGDSEKIEAYKFLLYLGREVTTSFEGRDHWGGRGIGDMLPTGEIARSRFLLDWVKDGTKPAERDLLDLLNFHISNRDNRGEALKAAVTELRKQYKNVWEGFKDSHWSQMPETWELKDDIDLAFDDIYNYVSELWTGRHPLIPPYEPDGEGDWDWGIEDSKTTKKSLFGRFKR